MNETHEIIFLVAADSDDQTAITESISQLCPTAAADMEVTRSKGMVVAAEVIIAVTLAVPTIISLIETIRRAVRRGIVIDATEPDMVVNTQTDLPRGLIVIRTKDGELTVKGDEPFPSSISSTLKALRKAKD